MKKLFETNWIRTLVSLILTFVIVQLLISFNIINSYLQTTLATICINIILAVSLNLITGFTGQFSLGHAGFMSIGAYVCAIITLRIPTIPGFIIGVLAGALYASTFNFIDPKIFGFSKSIDILVIVVLGGLGSISGSIIAAILLAVVTTYLQAFANIQMILYSLLLVVIMIFRPQGLMGSKELSLSTFSKLGNSFKSKKERV